MSLAEQYTVNDEKTYYAVLGVFEDATRFIHGISNFGERADTYWNSRFVRDFENSAMITDRLEDLYQQSEILFRQLSPYTFAERVIELPEGSNFGRIPIRFVHRLIDSEGGSSPLDSYAFYVWSEYGKGHQRVDKLAIHLLPGYLSDDPPGYEARIESNIYKGKAGASKILAAQTTKLENHAQHYITGELKSIVVPHYRIIQSNNFKIETQPLELAITDTEMDA